MLLSHTASVKRLTISNCSINSQTFEFLNDDDYKPMKIEELVYYCQNLNLKQLDCLFEMLGSTSLKSSLKYLRLCNTKTRAQEERIRESVSSAGFNVKIEFSPIFPMPRRVVKENYF